mgnify:CR=1 FL=1
MVAAPVLAQPASPAPVGKARRADLGLSPRDLESVKEKVKDDELEAEDLAIDEDEEPSADDEVDLATDDDDLGVETGAKDEES